MIAHELSGDSELFFYHTLEEAKDKRREFLSGIKDLFDLEIDIENQKTYMSMYINDVPEFDYCSVFLKVGSIIAEDTHDHYLVNFAPSIYESDLFTDTEKNILERFERYEEDYREFEMEDSSTEDFKQVHFELDFMDAIDTIRIGKIKYQ